MATVAVSGRVGSSWGASVAMTGMLETTGLRTSGATKLGSPSAQLQDCLQGCFLFLFLLYFLLIKSLKLFCT